MAVLRWGILTLMCALLGGLLPGCFLFNPRGAERDLLEVREVSAPAPAAMKLAAEVLRENGFEVEPGSGGDAGCMRGRVPVIPGLDPDKVPRGVEIVLGVVALGMDVVSPVTGGGNSGGAWIVLLGGRDEPSGWVLAITAAPLPDGRCVMRVTATLNGELRVRNYRTHEFWDSIAKTVVVAPATPESAALVPQVEP